MTDINPCPGCGGKPTVYTHNVFLNESDPPENDTQEYYVRCLNCHLRTGACDTPEEAIERWNEKTTPQTDVSSDRKVNNPLFCCKGLFGMIMHNRKNICILNGKFLAINGEDNWTTPVKYCPSCGKEIRLTFLADSEVDE